MRVFDGMCVTVNKFVCRYAMMTNAMWMDVFDNVCELLSCDACDCACV